MSMNQPNQQQQPQTSQSFQQIVSEVKSLIDKEDYQKLKQLIDKEVRLTESLTYFKVTANGDQAQNYDRLEKLQAKWSHGADISQEMKQQILYPLIDQLSLDVNRVIELCDWYFKVAPVNYEKIIQAEKIIAEIQSKSTQQVQAQGQIQNLRAQLDCWHNQLKAFCQKVVSDVKLAYLHNRHCLVETTMILAVSSVDQVKAVVRDLLNKKGAVLNIVKSLIRNVEWEREFQNLPPGEKNENLTINIFKEQSCLLSTLLAFWSDNEAKKDEQEAFIEFLSLTRFQGQMRRGQIYGESAAETLKRQEIKLLSQLSALAMMRVRSQNPQLQIQMIVEPNQITQASSFVYLIMAVLTKQMPKYTSRFNELALLEEFEEIMQWSSKPDFCLKGKAVSLLNSWLNILFDFEQSKQSIARNNPLLQQILEIGLNLLRDQSAVASVWKEGIQSLRIYKEVFDKPIEHFEKYMLILLKLCGSQKAPYARQVMGLIEEKNWKEIFGWITIKLQDLSEKKLNEIEIVGLISAVSLITKLIKQAPQYFESLQQIYNETATESRAGTSQIKFDPAKSAHRLSGYSASRGNIRQEGGVMFESGAFPLLSLLVKSLHSFFDLNFYYGNKPICNVLDALTKIFKTYSDQKSAIFQLLYQYTSQGQGRNPLLIEQMTDLSQFKPQQLVSFLKFVEAAFNQQNSFGSLPENEVYAPNRNFLCLALNQVYAPIVQNYYNINFTIEKEKSAFMNQIFKLTLALLSKFDQVSDDGQKVLLAQPTPYFDFQLQVIAEVLNPVQINQMCLQAIYVVQSRLFRNELSFINKTVHDLNGGEQSRHFVRMINSAIKVLNKMIALSLSTGQTNNKEIASLKSTYITNLLSIQDLHQSISDQTTLRMEDQTLLTIPALMTCYVQPSGSMVSHEKIRIGALQFLTSSLRILGHSNFLATLKSTFGSQLQNQLSFISILTNENQVALSIAYLEFWIQVVETQGNLAEELWQTKDAKVLADALQSPYGNVFPPLKNTLKQKICILLSLMSVKRCCIKVLETNSQMVLPRIYECVVAPLLDEVNDSRVILSGEVLTGVNDIDATVLEIVSSFNAKITIYYFMKLLQSEFEREPSSKIIRQLIEKLYCEKAFQAIAVGRNPEEAFQGLFALVQRVNEMYLRDNQSRPHYNQAHFQAKSRLQGFEERFQAGKLTSLFSPDGSVFLSNLNSKDQYEVLQSHQLYRFYNSEIRMSESNGMFGAKFAVDVDELEQKLIEEGYESQTAQQICCIFREYNLALSMVSINTFILKAKTEFMLKISQTQMSVVQRKQVSSDLVLTASMMALISSEEFYPKNKEEVVKPRLKLVDWSVNQVMALNEGIDKSRTKIANTLLAKHLEAQISNLTVHLGVVGHLITALGNDQNLRKQIPDVMVSLLQTLPDNGYFKNDDQDSHILFCQVITLILQIQVALEQKCTTSIILKSLGNVISGMQRGHCMIEGIQIFTLICGMIDSDSLVALMNRQTQGSPLQLIISRIQDSKISSEEMQLILTLLQSFARSVEGSENLHKNKVLNHLINCESFRLLDLQSPYVTTNQEQNRNHVHTWWLQVLALVRQINTNLIRNPRVQDSAYFKELNRIVKILTPRFQSVLSVTLPQVAPSATSTGSLICIAVLEETELICQILSQMFQHADFWVELDKSTFAEMKDLMLFAVPKVFSNCIEMRSLLPSSITERHLAGISVSGVERASLLGSQNERTALQLKMEMSMVNAIMSCTASLHNIVSLQKQNQNSQMILTWGRIDHASQSGFERTYLNTQVREPYIQFAFENYLRAMTGLKDLYLNLREPKNQVKKMISTISEIFLNDQWVLSEYQGGLASILIEESFENLLENIEVTLAMGMFVLSGILEQIQSVLSGVEGFTGGSVYGARYQINNWGMQDTEYGHGQIEERHLVLMAKNLAQTIRQLHETVNQNNPPWADDNYLQSILSYTESLTNNPSGTMLYY